MLMQFHHHLVLKIHSTYYNNDVTCRIMTFWGLSSGFTVVLTAPPIPPTADAKDTADFSCVTPLTGAGSILVGDFTTVVEPGIIVIFAGDFTGEDTSLFTIILCKDT